MRLTYSGTRMEGILDYRSSDERGNRINVWGLIANHIRQNHPKWTSEEILRRINDDVLGNESLGIELGLISYNFGGRFRINLASIELAEDYARMILERCPEVKFEDLRVLGTIFKKGLEGKLPSPEDVKSS